MDVTPATPKGLPVLAAYGDGGFRIADEVYQGAICISASGPALWALNNPAGLILSDFLWVFELTPRPDVLIIGTGKTMRALVPEIRAALREKGISVDAMDTGAACRTYNVLSTEGRRVAAALVGI